MTSILKKTVKVIFYTVIAFILFMLVYFNLYQTFIYHSDDQIKAYLTQYQSDFDALIEAKTANCGNYFERSEQFRYDVDTKKYNKIEWYYDDFFSQSPESQKFLAKHKDFIASVHDRTNSLQNTGYSVSYEGNTWQSAMADCQVRPYVRFYLAKQTSYVKLTGLSLQGPYYLRKRIDYIANPEADLAKDWRFYQQQPAIYNDLFDNQHQYGSENHDRLSTMLYRASDIASDEFVQHCKEWTYPGFTQVRPNWFILANDGTHHTTCGTDYIALPFVLILESFLFNYGV